MGVIKNKKEWVAIQDVVKDDFIKCMKADELINIVKIMNIRVPGFSKNVHKAPIQLLNNVFEKELKKVKILNDFMKTYSGSKYKEVKELEYSEGIKKLVSDDSLSNSEIIALLSILYPEEYMELRNEFKDNIGTSKNLLNGIIDISLEDVLESLVRRNIEVAKRAYNLSDGLKNDFDNESIAEYFNQEYELDSIAATSIILEGRDDIELTKEEKEHMYELSIIELVKQYSDKIIDNIELETSMKEKDDENNKLREDIQRLELKNDSLRNEKEEEVDLFNNNYKELKEDYKLNIEILSQKAEELQEELRKEKENEQHLITQADSITLYTDRQDEFSQFIHSSNLKSINDLNIEDSERDQFTLVDVFAMSTKNKRRINKLAKVEENKTRLLNGAPMHIIRTIIYYLEGDDPSEA